MHYRAVSKLLVCVIICIFFIRCNESEVHFEQGGDGMLIIELNTSSYSRIENVGYAFFSIQNDKKEFVLKQKMYSVSVENRHMYVEGLELPGGNYTLRGLYLVDSDFVPLAIINDEKSGIADKFFVESGKDCKLKVDMREITEKTCDLSDSGYYPIEKSSVSTKQYQDFSGMWLMTTTTAGVLNEDIETQIFHITINNSDVLVYDETMQHMTKASIENNMIVFAPDNKLGLSVLVLKDKDKMTEGVLSCEGCPYSYMQRIAVVQNICVTVKIISPYAKNDLQLSVIADNETIVYNTAVDRGVINVEFKNKAYESYTFILSSRATDCITTEDVSVYDIGDYACINAKASEIIDLDLCK